jgi:hypothetical protein
LACGACARAIELQYASHCPECAAERRARAYAQRIADATTLTYAEWVASRADGELLTDGEDFWTWWPGHWFAGGDPPTHLWATTRRPMGIGPDDIYSMLEAAAEEHHDEAEWDDIDELLDFVAAWSAKQTGGSWHQDDTRVVLSPPEVTRQARQVSGAPHGLPMQVEIREVTDE